MPDRGIIYLYDLKSQIVNSTISKNKPYLRYTLIYIMCLLCNASAYKGSDPNSIICDIVQNITDTPDQ